jgi:hypothetical protein
MWTEKWVQDHVPKSVTDTFETFDWRESPAEFATSKRNIENYIYQSICSGSVPQQYIGNHGVGGLLFPPLDTFDPHLEWYVEKP